MIRSQRRIGRLLIDGWGQGFEELRMMMLYERNARWEAALPYMDVNDLLDRATDLWHRLFENQMHPLVQIVLANARAFMLSGISRPSGSRSESGSLGGGLALGVVSLGVRVSHLIKFEICVARCPH